jgi:hypothetical protein
MDMQKLPAVEQAKALMTEARDWSVWRWLTEKRRVRAAADKATEALGEREKQIKAGWSDDVRKAYRALDARGGNGRVASGLLPVLRKLKAVEQTAETARLDAEATFDEAERMLSPSMARQGTTKAIESWELREKAIRQAEAVGRKMNV